MNRKTLVAYFSASGVTAAAAEKAAEAIGADLHEIAPLQRYTDADLNWMDSKSRTTLESKNPDCRPALAPTDLDVSSYDTILLGFPVWWYVEPRIIDTFLEAYDFAGKTVIPFATSSSSGMGQSGTLLSEMAGTGDWQDGQRFSSGASQSDVADWVSGLGLNG